MSPPTPAVPRARAPWRAVWPVTVDIADSQPVYRQGLARVVSSDASFTVGHLAATPDEVPNGHRILLSGLATGSPPDLDLMERLQASGRSVVVVLPPGAHHAVPALSQVVAGGVQREATPATILRALRAVAAGRPSWLLGVGMRAAEQGAGSGLSGRELELLRLLAAGSTDQEIAKSMNISVRTVWSHLDRIRNKTGVRRRVSLAFLAYGLTPPESAVDINPRSSFRAS